MVAAIWDHPRVCGEHHAWATVEDTDAGSSPRMRGAPMETSADLEVPGIIPAYAGSTHQTKPTLESQGDHPRVCGEHFVQIRSPG